MLESTSAQLLTRTLRREPRALPPQRGIAGDETTTPAESLEYPTYSRRLCRNIKMSRRAIKRYEQVLQGDRFAQEGAEDRDDIVAEEQSLQPSPYAQRSQGLFALLGEEDEDDSDNQKDTEQATHLPADTYRSDSSLPPGAIEVDEAEQQEVPGQDDGAVQKSQIPAPEREKKKRKRKRKGKRKGNIADHETDPDWIALNEVNAIPCIERETATPGWIPSSYFASDDTDEVKAEAERVMATVEGMVARDPADNTDFIDLSSTPHICKELQVEPRLLNAKSEMKRLFGARVMDSERGADDVAGGRRRARTDGRAHLRRKVSIVSPRDTWFAEAPGLVMVEDKEATNDSSNGMRYYRYVHEASYAKIQDEYRVLVGTHDPNLLAEFSSRYPYHVDALLQLAELYRQMGELDRAAEMIERCLYVLETSWNISFKPYKGTCRLRFEVLENRALYIALFRYSQLLTRRGLHRTALEISKLLLSLDPECDPMGMLMLSDSLALLCKEHKWIQNMHSNFNLIPVRFFPNFVASLSLAGIPAKRGGVPNQGGTAKERKGATSVKRDEDVPDDRVRAEYLLTDALLTFPMLLKPLLNAIQDDSGVWTESRLFDEAWYSAGYDDHGVLTRICRVYAERSKLLWNSTFNKRLLIDSARAAGVLDNAAGGGKDPDTGRSSSAFVSDPVKFHRVAGCRALRAEAAGWLRNCGLYRGIQIADFTDSTTNLPAELLAGDGGDQAVGAPTPRDLTLTESVREFLQSLLPWREASDAQQ